MKKLCILCVWLCFWAGTVSAGAAVTPSVLYTEPSNERPVVFKSVTCQVQNNNLVISAAPAGKEVGQKNTLRIELKAYDEYDFSKRLVLTRQSWGEVDFWDMFGAEWSIPEEKPQSFCSLKFLNVSKDEAGLVNGFDMGMKCEGLKAERVTPTRSLEIPLKAPLRCSF